MTDLTWLAPAAALDYLSVVEGSDQAAVVESCRLAACRVVESKRPDLLSVDAQGVETFAADEAVQHGTLLLLARLYARKGSPVGVATFGELGAASIVRSDPDVQLLLGLGRHASPRVG